MTRDITVRAAQADDIAQIAAIAGETLFPAEMTAELIAPYLDGAPAHWLVADTGAGLAGFAFAEPEQMTDRTWNLKAIAVAPDHRRQGAGRALLEGMEHALAGQARLMVIDTTQLEDQAAGRHLYARCGYAQTAVVPEFWGPGEDKVTFAKALT